MPSAGARLAIADGPKAETSMASSKKLAVARYVAATFFVKIKASMSHLQ